MSSISTTDARGLFTKALLAKYQDFPETTSFLRNMFTDRIEMTKEINIEVQRGDENIAVGVQRGSIGNRNQWTQSTEKIFIPEYHREYFDATELSLYDRLFGSTSIDDGVFTAFVEQVAFKQRELVKKIERKYEKMCSDVLMTGIVTYDQGTIIDYKRKAASNVDPGAGNYWATGTVDPYADLASGCEFIRTDGQIDISTVDVIMGKTALQHFLNNDIVKARADIRNYMLDSIKSPNRSTAGAAYHGTVTAGSYNVNIWTYPQYYRPVGGGAKLPYIDDKKIVITPQQPDFVMAYGAVPQLATLGGGVRKGKFLFDNYVDERNASHDFDVKSAGLPVPVGVDQIYTVQVVA